MLSLIFKETVLTSASIPVRWCLDAEALVQVEETGLKPFILIKLTYNNRYKPKRYLFPVDQLTAYLDVHRAGPITITAVLVTIEANSKAAMHYGFIADHCDREECYPHSVFSINYAKKYFKAKSYDQTEEYHFEVPKGLFGKEIPEWAKFYVNRYWYSAQFKCQDECEQRRRVMLFFITTLPILIFEFLGRFLFNVVATIFSYLVLTLVGFDYIRHPFTKFTMEKGKCLIDEFVNHVTASEKVSTGFVIVTLLPFIPLVALVFINLIFWTQNYGLADSVKLYFAGYYLGAAAITMIVLFCKFCIKAFKVSSDWLDARLPKAIPACFEFIVTCVEATLAGIMWVFVFPFMWLSNRIEPDADMIRAERQRLLLTCPKADGECLPPIKLKDKKVRVIYADIKNKVCKPMQG